MSDQTGHRPLHLHDGTSEQATERPRETRPGDPLCDPVADRRAVTRATAAMALVGGAVTASAYLSDATMAAQTVRYVGTAAVLVAVSRLLRQRGSAWLVRRPAGREWWWLVAAATAGLTIYNLALVAALDRAEAPLVASIVAGVPLALAVMGPLMAGRSIGPRLVAGAATVVAGSFLVFGGGRSDGIGVVLAAVALACECGFTLLGVPVLARLGAISIATHTAWIAAVQLGVLAIVRGEMTTVGSWNLAAVLAVIYLIGASAAAFVLWFGAIGTIGAERAGLTAGVIPIAALATGVPLGVASARPFTLVGTMVVVLGLMIGLSAGRAERALVNA